MAKKKSKMYQEVYIKKICHAKKHANKVGMMHDESKGQRIGKAPSLHLFHTTVRHAASLGAEFASMQLLMLCISITH